MCSSCRRRAGTAHPPALLRRGRRIFWQVVEALRRDDHSIRARSGCSGLRFSILVVRERCEIRKTVELPGGRVGAVSVTNSWVPHRISNSTNVRVFVLRSSRGIVEVPAVVPVAFTVQSCTRSAALQSQRYNQYAVSRFNECRTYRMLLVA